MIQTQTQFKSDPHFWSKQGLQHGLRIIAINNASLIDDYNIEDDDGHIDKELTEEAIQDLLAEADTDKFITIEFREEVSPEDYSVPLGLGIDEETLLTMRSMRESQEQEESKREDNNIIATKTTSLTVSPPSHAKAPSTSLQAKTSTFKNTFERIEDGQIGASSFEEGYEPSNCRLNHELYWQPSSDDQTTLDTWLRIDLGMKKMVTKMQLQGIMCYLVLFYLQSLFVFMVSEKRLSECMRSHGQNMCLCLCK